MILQIGVEDEEAVVGERIDKAKFVDWNGACHLISEC